MNNLNHILLRRRNQIAVTPSVVVVNNTYAPLNYILTMSRALEQYGYVLSENLISRCQDLTTSDVISLYSWLKDALAKQTGAHRTHKPMYHNFPQEVMEMDEAVLYMNAIIHYWTGGEWMPPSEVQERFPLTDSIKLRQLDVAKDDLIHTIFEQLCQSNVAWSTQDKEDVETYIQHFQTHVKMPSSIPQKENIASFVQMLVKHKLADASTLSIFCSTATDILRVATALSDGDVSLAENTKFRNFTRAERKVLLGILEHISHKNDIVEDMLRYKGRWIRLAEKTHVGEYKKQYPNVFDSISKLRNNVKVETSNSKVEKSLSNSDVNTAVNLLSKKPGELARRLDHLLRLTPYDTNNVVKSFKKVSDKVSTPVLLQVMTHFQNRGENASYRTFFPKGNVAKAKVIDNTLDTMDGDVCNDIVTVCQDTLINRFSKLPSLGDTYIDPKLLNYNVPAGMRSASKSLRTLTRGSRVELDTQCKVLRFFCYWKENASRADIDLSATLMDENFQFISTLAYYNLRELAGCHSGDITSAPDGASEFIDVNLQKVRESGARYIVMTLNSYTNQPYCDLKECFAGWMSREHADSGEIFEPTTVTDRVDITANTRMAIPMIVDTWDHSVIWCDLSLKSVSWNNVKNNLGGVSATLRGVVTMRKPNLYDLLSLHVKARGMQSTGVKPAKTVFDSKDFPFKTEEIASEYMK